MENNYTFSKLEEYIHAPDLMLGDWILTPDNNPAQVVGLTIDSIETTEKEGYFYDELFKPIPLTGEILEKNGFTKMKNRDGHIFYIYFSFIEDGHVSVRITDYHSEWDITIYVISKSPIKTLSFGSYLFKVHELQHILKSSNTNKEIIL